MKRIFLLALVMLLTSPFAISGSGHASGKITSLKASATAPAIRLTGNISPDLCDGGTYGWLYFRGTAQEQQWIYATALALSLSGVSVTVYTNTDGGRCKIYDIQATSL
ncbi:MAG: hypothetical protein MK096_15040 [Oleiphilaceae bacterium]|nr:hypothetical protein [Oleiphilaceae bacterium]